MDAAQCACRRHRHEVWHEPGVRLHCSSQYRNQFRRLHTAAQAWTAAGKKVPLTCIELQDLQVVKRREEWRDGVNALQLGGGWQKRKRMTTGEANAFDSLGLAYKRYLREFRVTEDALLPVGTTINARHFVPGQFVDVQGVTKGKGVGTPLPPRASPSARLSLGALSLGSLALTPSLVD